MKNNQARTTTYSVLGTLWRETLRTSNELFRVMIPAVIVTKILESLGLVTYVSELLEPVMGVMGLPGSLGIVWATALLTTPYGAIAVFASMAPGMDLTSGQVTILCSIVLIAHSLPVELSITKKAGVGVLPMGVLRIFSALVYGFLLHLLISSTGIWQEPVHMFFSGGSEESSIWQWAGSQIINLGIIFFVIFCILSAMHLLRIVGGLKLLESVLRPVLPFFGMTPKAAPVTVIGMIMGLGFGGALIIRETTTGSLKKREIFNSLSLMGLSHGLLEDTLVMMTIGGKLSGILFGRLLFSLVVVYVLNKVMLSLEKRKVVNFNQ